MKLPEMPQDADDALAIIMRICAWGVGGIVALAMMGSAALAQQAAPCAPRDEIVAALTEKYGETRRGVGLANKGAVAEVYASDDTATWTIIITRPDGSACVVAAGEAWLDARAPWGPSL